MTLLDTARAVASRARVNRNDAAPDLSGTEQSIQNGAVAVRPAGRSRRDGGDDPRRHADHRRRTAIRPASPCSGSRPTRTTPRSTAPASARRTSRATPRSSRRSSPRRTTCPAADSAARSSTCAAAAARTSSGATNSLNVDAPQLQWTDRAARALGQQYSNLSLGGLLAGPIVFDKAFYNLSYQLGRRANDLRTLLNTDAGGLQAAGVAADSVARLLAIARRAADPDRRRQRPRVAAASATRARCSAASTSRRRHRAPADDEPHVQRQLEPPDARGELSDRAAGAQRRPHELESRRAGAAHGVREEHPAQRDDAGLQRQPQLRHAVPAAAERQRARELQLRRRHERRAHARLRRQRRSWAPAAARSTPRRSTSCPGSAGTTSTGSSSPASCGARATIRTRPPTRSARSATTRWPTSRPTAGVVHARAAAARRRAPASSSARSRSAIRTGAAPTSRSSTACGSTATASRPTPLLNPEVEKRVRRAQRPRAEPPVREPAHRLLVELRHRAADRRLRGRRARTARRRARRHRRLPEHAQRQLDRHRDRQHRARERRAAAHLRRRARCPIPDWAAYAQNPAAIPTQCADGTTGGVFANSAPNVTLFAKDFKAPRSVRSNLNWNGPMLGNRFNATVDLTYSLNLNQAEHARPQLPAHAAVRARRRGGASGVRAAGEHRPRDGRDRVARRARVAAVQPRERAAERSPKREQAASRRALPRVVHARASPGRSTTRWPTCASSTAASRAPRATRSTSRGRAPRANRATRSAYTLGYNFFDAVRVNWFGQFRSGSPFTPIIAGDVNGDGWTNDRAFVFDPVARERSRGGERDALAPRDRIGPRERLPHQAGRLDRVAQLAAAARGRRTRTSASRSTR